MFLTPPLEQETEITGPSAAKLFVSSSTTDADIFLVIQVFDPDGKEVVFHGALDPHTPIAQGWLRASHRKLDPKLSKPYRPYHTHDEIRPLTPGEIVELDVEIWPTCLVIPAGYRIGLSVRGKDYVYKGASGGRLSNMKNEFTGCGPFLHDDPQDRPPAIFGGKTTIHFARRPRQLRALADRAGETLTVAVAAAARRHRRAHHGIAQDHGERFRRRGRLTVAVPEDARRAHRRRVLDRDDAAGPSPRSAPDAK